MTIHFENRDKAIEHLTANGWRELKNSNWISRDGSCAASIHPHHFGDVVVVALWEIACAA